MAKQTLAFGKRTGSRPSQRLDDGRVDLVQPSAEALE